MKQVQMVSVAVLVLMAVVVADSAPPTGEMDIDISDLTEEQVRELLDSFTDAVISSSPAFRQLGEFYGVNEYIFFGIVKSVVNLALTDPRAFFAAVGFNYDTFNPNDPLMNNFNANILLSNANIREASSSIPKDSDRVALLENIASQVLPFAINFYVQDKGSEGRERFSASIGKYAGFG